MEKRWKKTISDFLGKTVHVVVDRPIGYQHKGITYPIHYGYIPGALAGDGEEQDAYILGVDKPVDAFEGRVIAVICREDDCEDKLVVAPEGVLYHQAQIAQAVAFQEQYFQSHIVSCLEQSCGVLAYRITDHVKKFLLVFETFSQCWSIPKGHMEAGETEVETALRELYEETGLTAKLDTTRSACIEYPISEVARKRVVFYSGKAEGIPRVREGEIDRYQWVTTEQLKEHLFPDTYRACLALLDDK